MIKKLFITAAAAAAMSVPLAGVAWADPPSGNNPPGQGATGPGIPNEVAGLFGSPKPVPPGSVFSTIAKEPGNVPAGAGNFLNTFYGGTTNFGPTAPGLGTKTFTPGCTSGHTATDPAVNGGGSICH
jgi:hypothetical protein